MTWQLSKADQGAFERAALSLALVKPYPADDYLEWVRSSIWGPGVNSTSRIGPLLNCLYRAPTDALMWQAFNLGWSTCDAVDAVALSLLHLRFDRADLHGWEVLEGEDAIFYAGLPPNVTLYRGADGTREHGISWTTDLEIALSFANGHRGIAVPNPTVFTAMVDKSDIWSVSVERSESEVLVSPAKLCGVAVLQQEPCI